MKIFFLHRVVTGLGVMLAVITLVFLLVRLTGDPAAALLPNEATAEDYEILYHELGLDRPLYIQYVIYIKNLAKFNLGVSARTRIPVREMLAERLPNSVKLAAVSMLMVIIMALPLGVAAALKRGRFVDWVSRVIAGIAQSLPSFWLGLMLMQIMAIRLKLLPVAGMGSFSHYILPAFSLGLMGIAGIMRLLRSSMIEVLDSDYIRMARIKGVSGTAVVWKHAFRNALIPVITYSGVYFAILIMSAVITETVFFWPGIGRMLWEGVLNRDFSVVQSVIFVITGIVVIVNLVVDIIYLYIDPRIRYQKE